jgi:hypothetical protein
MSRINLASAFVDLTLEDGRFGPRLAAVEKTMRGFQNRMESMGRFARNALLGLGAGLIFSAREAAKAEAAASKLEATLKATGGAAGLTAKEIHAFASELEGASLFDNDEIVSAAAALARFGNISGAVFKDALRAATDLSAATGTDLVSATTRLGKALNDPAKRYKTLANAGVQFSEAQATTIKAFVKTGDVVAAQRVLLEQLEDQFSGVAEASTKTFGGAMIMVWRDMKRVAETIGVAFIPALRAAATVLRGAVGPIDEFVRRNGDSLVAVTALSAGLLGIAYVLPKVTALVKGLAVATAFLAAHPLVAVTAGLVAIAGYFLYTTAEGETFAEKMEAIGPRVTGSLQPMFDTLKTGFDALVTSFETTRFALESWYTILQIGIARTQLFGVTVWETLKYYVGSLIPDLFKVTTEYLGNTFYNAFKYMQTVVQNWADNVSSVMIEVFDYITSWGEDPINFQFKGLTEGFERAAMQLPEIAEQQTSESVKKLSAKLEQLYKQLDDEQNAAQKRQENRDNTAQKKTIDRIRQQATTQPTKSREPAAASAKAAFVGLEDAFKQIQESALASVAKAHLAVAQQQLGVQQQTAGTAEKMNVNIANVAQAIAKLNVGGTFQ